MLGPDRYYTVRSFVLLTIVTRRASFDGMLVVIGRRWFVGRDSRERAHTHIRRTRP